jgi:hypothetical protein
VDPRGSRTTIVGDARAAIDGTAAEREPPLGAAVPEVVGFRRPDESAVSVAGSRLDVEPDDDKPWVMVVRNRAGAAVAVEVRVAPLGDVA